MGKMVLMEFLKSPLKTLKNEKVTIDGVEYIRKVAENVATSISNDVFDKIFEYILMVEGGYSNDKADKGGKTMGCQPPP